jgi:hypothetical protein
MGSPWPAWAWPCSRRPPSWPRPGWGSRPCSPRRLADALDGPLARPSATGNPGPGPFWTPPWYRAADFLYLAGVGCHAHARRESRPLGPCARSRPRSSPSWSATPRPAPNPWALPATVGLMERAPRFLLLAALVRRRPCSPPRPCASSGGLGLFWALTFATVLRRVRHVRGQLRGLGVGRCPTPRQGRLPPPLHPPAGAIGPMTPPTRRGPARPRRLARMGDSRAGGATGEAGGRKGSILLG